MKKRGKGRTLSTQRLKKPKITRRQVPFLKSRSCCLIEGQSKSDQKKMDGAEYMIKGGSFLNHDGKAWKLKCSGSQK